MTHLFVQVHYLVPESDVVQDGGVVSAEEGAEMAAAAAVCQWGESSSTSVVRWD